MIVTAGSTNKSVYVYFVDDDSGTSPGEPTTGLLFSDIETGGSASYVRQGAARTDFTLVTLASASAAHIDGGFILVDDTNMPGLYRLDVPDAAFTTGVDQVVIQLVAASGKNTVMRPIMVDITDVDLRDGVRGGLTALPNAVVDGAGGLVTSAGGATGIDDLATPTNITAGTITTVTNLTTNNDKTGYALSATGVDAIWDETMAGHVTADTAGLVMNDWQDAGRLDAILDTIAADVVNIDGIVPSAAGDAMTLTAAAVDLIWDELLSGHTTGGSTGKALNNAASFIVADGTCQATGQTSTNIRLAVGESATNDIYKNDEIVITGGAGQGESALITAYDGTNKDCTVSPALVITCDGTSTYEILPAHVHAENLGADAVDGTSLANDAITSAKIAAGAITSSEAPNLDATVSSRMAEASIDTTGGAVDNVTTTANVTTVNGLAANVITAASINAAALTAAKFGAGAIDANALATDAVNEIRDAILPTQNSAFNNIEFLFVAASDGRTPVTGATGTAVTRSIDGGAFGSGTGTLAEVGNGIYQYDASAADMNGGIITFRFTGTGGTPGAPDDRFVTIVTGGGV
jgi:hypothetical protein